MGENGRTGAPHALQHGEPGSFQLVGTGLPCQLQHNLCCLIEGGCADGVSSRFQAPHGGNRQTPFAENVPFGCQLPACSSLSKPAGFQKQACHNAERIMHLEKINVGRCQPRTAKRLLC